MGWGDNYPLELCAWALYGRTMGMDEKQQPEHAMGLTDVTHKQSSLQGTSGSGRHDVARLELGASGGEASEPGSVTDLGQSGIKDSGLGNVTSLEQGSIADLSSGNVTDLEQSGVVDSGLGRVMPSVEDTVARLGLDGLRHPENAEEELKNLRKLLLSQEIRAIEALETRLNDKQTHAEDISHVIAEALLIRADKDTRLSAVLEPVLADAFSGLIRKKPQELATEIFPLMGPAIRRSIAETFHSMLSSFQKQIETSFSLKGIHWRFEALKTGKPFSEIVLLHTLVYRVEQVFFIHSQTGLVLSHIVHDGVDVQDADLVSAMLTAVQDFVKDCLSSAQGGGDELSSMSFGDGVILVEKHPYASLACIVRGTPPVGFRARMAEMLDMLLVKYAHALTDFSGDSAPFAEAAHLLDECLVSRSVDEEKPLSFWIKAIPVVSLFVLMFVLGGKHYYDARVHEEYMQGIEHLRSSAGITVIEVREEEAPWQVYCLKDMLAPSPEEYLAQAGIEASHYVFHVTPVVSYSSEAVMSHVLHAVRPPETVASHLSEGGVLSFYGVASTGWQLRAKNKALTLSGVNDVNMEGVHDPQAEKLQGLLRTVESSVIVFPFNKSLPVGEEYTKLQRAVNALVALEHLAKSMGMQVSLTVYGHADKIGTDKSNYEISQARATTIASMLYSQGSSTPIALYAMGAEHAKDGDVSGTLGDLASRRVELRVHLQQAVEPQGHLLGD